MNTLKTASKENPTGCFVCSTMLSRMIPASKRYYQIFLKTILYALVLFRSETDDLMRISSSVSRTLFFLVPL